jgi:hypothetical protein
MNIQQAALSNERRPQSQTPSSTQMPAEHGYTVVLSSDGPYTSKFTIHNSTGTLVRPDFLRTGSPGSYYDQAVNLQMRLFSAFPEDRFFWTILCEPQ